VHLRVVEAHGVKIVVLRNSHYDVRLFGDQGLGVDFGLELIFVRRMLDRETFIFSTTNGMLFRIF
jgi:hypothetical protein